MTRTATVITSLTNERVKAIRALDMRKTRRETGLFVAEGASLLITARDRGYVPKTLVYQAGTNESGIVKGLIAWASKEGADVLEVSEAVLAKLASKENPQTVLGVFSQMFAPSPDVAKLGTNETWLALEEIRDPGNLGTIIRTSEAVGVSGIFLVGSCCDPFSSECVRATMGSIFSVPLVKLERENFLGLVRGWPGDVIATHLDATEDFRSPDYRGPQLVLMGSEGPGLSDALAQEARRRVKIPMSGALDSLNLAIATALMLYHIRGPYLKL